MIVRFLDTGGIGLNFLFMNVSFFSHKIQDFHN